MNLCQIQKLRAWVSLVAVMGAITVCAAQSRAGSLAFDGRGSVMYDDNLNRAEQGNQKADDTIFTFDGSGAYRLQIGESGGVIARLGLAADVHTDIGDLDALRAKTALTYLFQPVRGFRAPWFALGADFELLEFSASDIRDGTIAGASAETGLRFTDRIALRAGYRVQDRDASKALVFEEHQWIVHGLVDYIVNDRISAFIKYEYLNGGVVTSAPPNPRFRGVTRRFWSDRVFGRDFVAWRLSGEANSVRFGAKYALQKKTALDFAVTRAVTDADGDNHWNVWNVGLSLTHRFD